MDLFAYFQRGLEFLSIGFWVAFVFVCFWMAGEKLYRWAVAIRNPKPPAPFQLRPSQPWHNPNPVQREGGLPTTINYQDLPKFDVLYDKYPRTMWGVLVVAGVLMSPVLLFSAAIGGTFFLMMVLFGLCQHAYRLLRGRFPTEE